MRCAFCYPRPPSLSSIPNLLLGSDGKFEGICIFWRSRVGIVAGGGGAGPFV